MYGESNDTIHLTSSDLERSKSRAVESQSLISRKGANLDPMLLFTINRKPCMVSPMIPSHLTLSDLEGQSQGHADFKALYLVKEPS